MKDRAQENLIELLQRFMDEPAAHEAHQDIQAGERWLDAYPAPAPRSQVVAAIHAQMALSARRRQRVVRLIHTSLAAAAAIVILALIGLLGPHPASQSPVTLVALLSAADWDSDDITADDVNLAHFSSEIGQIEAQMQALDGDENEIGVGAPDELEMELQALQAEFLKG